MKGISIRNDMGFCSGEKFWYKIVSGLKSIKGKCDLEEGVYMGGCYLNEP